MDWVAAKSYYIGYKAIDRFLTICFTHNYLITWSTALGCSLILPLLFIFAPNSLHTTRTIHFLLVCLVCLSYMCSLYIQTYMISGAGEPNLSFHTCRFIVYISTFAKPNSIYLTLLFSIERLFTKILSKFFSRVKHYRQLSQKLYALFILLGLTFICAKRLYDVLKLLPQKQSIEEDTGSDIGIDTSADITDTSANSTDRNITFTYCFNAINIDTYAKILSFYVIQYWFEYVLLGIIILVLLIMIFQQCCLSRNQPQGSVRRFSVNTKLYLSLSSCVIVSEISLLFLHFIVDDDGNNNTDLQLVSLQIMLFVFNFRCIILPLVVCMITCDPLKQFLYELFIVRPYLDNIDETDHTDTINDRPEPFSSPRQTNNHIPQKIRRIFTRNHKNNNDYIDNDESQAEL